MDVNYTVTDNEAQAILQILGDLPTKTNVFPLLKKLEEQYRSAQQDNTQPV